MYANIGGPKDIKAVIENDAGGVGLCEAVQHLSMFDFVAVSGSKTDRMIEAVTHLHEHFVTPIELRAGNYWPPQAPGAGTEMKRDSLEQFSYPDGPVWREAVFQNVWS